jgi:predicted Rossmann fold flavoprotein
MDLQIIVIGGGASGMMAAITAAETYPQNEILLLERQARVGRKLLSTGNGRCNLTNLNMDPSHFNGADPFFVSPSLEALDVLRWFRERGLLTVREPSGRVYPLSDSSNSVLDILRFSLERPNVNLLTGCEVRSVKTSGGQFFAHTDAGTFCADRMIVACGGLAGTKLGGGMSGYQLLRSLGHTASKLMPSLVQVVTGGSFVRALKGIRADAGVMLFSEDSLCAASAGEVQFIDSGVSGPAIFEVSRAVSAAVSALTIRFDFFREYSADQILNLLQERMERYPKLPAEELLTGMLHNRLGKMLIRSAGLAMEAPICTLTKSQLASVVSAAKGFTLPVTGTLGMDCAQVTAGGILTEDFSSKTLESKICSGLYACGEVLDIDGDCGGYNLHWAFASGHMAGLLKEESKLASDS